VDAGFDLAAKFEGGQQRALAADETAGHFVDGLDGADRHAAFDGFDDAVVVVDIDLVAGLDKDDLGAQAFGVGDDRTGFNAEGFGLVAGGDADGGIGHHGNDADGTAAQLGADLLLDRCEVGVEIDEEPVETRDGAEILRGRGFWRPRWTDRIGEAKLRAPLVGGKFRLRIGRGGHLATIFVLCSLYCKDIVNCPGVTMLC